MNSKELLEQADQKIAEIENIKKTRESIEEIEQLNLSLGNVITRILFLQGNSEHRPDAVIESDEYRELKITVADKLDEFLQRRISKLEQLLGIQPVVPEIVIPIPELAKGGVVPMECKPATINPEFEAATKDMFESVKKHDQVPEKQEEKFEVHSITAEDKSLSSYPAKKDKRIKTPSNMIEADIRRMYIDEEKDRKTIAEFYGVSEGKINNFLYLHDIKRKKAPKPDKQPEETERP